MSVREENSFFIPRFNKLKILKSCVLLNGSPVVEGRELVIAMHFAGEDGSPLEDREPNLIWSEALGSSYIYLSGAPDGRGFHILPDFTLPAAAAGAVVRLVKWRHSSAIDLSSARLFVERPLAGYDGTVLQECFKAREGLK